MLLAAAGFIPYATAYTATGAQTIAIPAGASTVTIECIGPGGPGGSDGDNEWGSGGGGAYSKKTSYSVAGLSGIYLYVAPSTTSLVSGVATLAKANNSSGAVICSADYGHGRYANGDAVGGAAANGTGDVKYSGGAGQVGDRNDYAGGGAGGPTGNGGNGNLASPGSGNGIPAGSGGGGGNPGNIYGGGGGTYSAGAQGWIRLSWA